MCHKFFLRSWNNKGGGGKVAWNSSDITSHYFVFVTEISVCKTSLQVRLTLRFLAPEEDVKYSWRVIPWKRKLRSASNRAMNKIGECFELTRITFLFLRYSTSVPLLDFILYISRWRDGPLLEMSTLRDVKIMGTCKSDHAKACSLPFVLFLECHSQVLAWFQPV